MLIRAFHMPPNNILGFMLAGVNVIWNDKFNTVRYPFSLSRWLQKNEGKSGTFYLSEEDIWLQERNSQKVKVCL